VSTSTEEIQERVEEQPVAHASEDFKMPPKKKGRPPKIKDEASVNNSVDVKAEESPSKSAVKIKERLSVGSEKQDSSIHTLETIESTADAPSISAGPSKPPKKKSRASWSEDVDVAEHEKSIEGELVTVNSSKGSSKKKQRMSMGEDEDQSKHEYASKSSSSKKERAHAPVVDDAEDDDDAGADFAGASHSRPAPKGCFKVCKCEEIRAC
jgi:hypothetical protein